MKPSLDDQAGRLILGRYRLVMPLAKGGQGVVYLARGEGAAGFTLPVVIKRVLSPIAKDPEANERFVREARITAQLRHPDIVSILDFERESDDSYVMVLEYVHGYDLAKWRSFVREDGRRFDAQLAAYITVRVLDALHYSHSMRGQAGEPTPIIHRDISPGNVLIDDEGQVKITDFGIAHSKVHETDEPSSTTRVELKGKLAFLSPELYRGALPTAQSDLYACAVMLHQLLVGENEFQARDLMSAALRVATHVPTRVSKVRDDVSETAASVIAKALAKEPEERHATARELSAELRRAFSLDLGEMPERLMQAVRKDFFDPRFAPLTKTLELGSIDRAWRDLPAAAPLTQLAPRIQVNSVPTLQAPLSLRPLGAGVAAPTPEKPAPKLASWIMLGVAVLAVAFAVAFFANRQLGEDRVVFVDAHTQAAAALAEGTEREPGHAPLPPARAIAAPDASVTTPDVVAPEPVKKPEGTRALTRAFAARRQEVERCFTEHSAGLEGAPRIYVEFEISTAGTVSAARLDPDSVESSELGRCLLSAAKATRFEPQSAELRFRIPLTARSQ